jgi:hypothetical protein
MLAMLMLLAVAGAEPTPVPAPADQPPIDVRGRRERLICNRETAPGGSRIVTGRVCLTQRQWQERRDQAVDLMNDMPRRNPRAGGRTIPDAMHPDMDGL